METDKDLIGCDLPRRVAMKDISEYLYDQDRMWVITPNNMNNKETSILNKKLGVHKVNKFGVRMSRNK